MNSVYTRIKLLESELESIGDSETNSNDDKVLSDSELFNKFIKYCKLYLKLETIPKIILTKNSSKIKTYGRYDPVKKEIIVYIKDRAIGDVLRSIAHELIHYKQHLNNELLSGSGKTGSNQENDANSQAGIIMRNFGKLNPVIYESLNKDITKYIDELILEAKLFVPRGIVDRSKKEAIITYKRILKYIENGSVGDLTIEDSAITEFPNELTRVGGTLRIVNCNNLKKIPSSLKVDGTFSISGCPLLKFLSNKLEVGKSLDIYNVGIEDLPDELIIGKKLTLEDCNKLISIPKTIVVTSIHIESCRNFISLPDELILEGYLHLFKLPNFTVLPDNLHINAELSIYDTEITDLPSGLYVGGSLYLRKNPVNSVGYRVKGFDIHQYLESIGGVVKGNIELGIN